MIDETIATVLGLVVRWSSQSAEFSIAAGCSEVVNLDGSMLAYFQEESE